jgi:hypothetical protein
MRVRQQNQSLLQELPIHPAVLKLVDAQALDAEVER